MPLALPIACVLDAIKSTCEITITSPSSSRLPQQVSATINGYELVSMKKLLATQALLSSRFYMQFTEDMIPFHVLRAGQSDEKTE